MMMRFSILLITAILYLGTPLITQAQPNYPAPKKPLRLVNDFVEVLSAAEQNTLEQKLRAYEDSTKNEIAVVIVENTGGEDDLFYCSTLAEKWGVGKKGANNGVMLLVAYKQRDVSICTGYGTEPYLTDIYTNRVIDQIIVPAFKRGDYYGGIQGGTDAIMAGLLGATFGDIKTEQPSNWVFLMLFFGVLGFFILISYTAKHTDAGTTVSSSGRRSHGGPIFRGGGGGFGRGGGGGFGGFGGGSFGGGGASGSW